MTSDVYAGYIHKNFPCQVWKNLAILPEAWAVPLIYFSFMKSQPVAVYDGCDSVAFVYWLRLKQYL